MGEGGCTFTTTVSAMFFFISSTFGDLGEKSNILTNRRNHISLNRVSTKSKNTKKGYNVCNEKKL